MGTMTVLGEAASMAGLAVRIALAAIFCEAALHALRDRNGFAGIIQAYRILPERMAAAASWLVPAAEIFAALALLVWPAPGFGAGLALLAAFTAAIAINLHRGRNTIACGCGGASHGISLSIVVRNLVLLAALAGAALAPHAPPANPASWVAAAGSAAFLALLYFAANQLMANAQALAGAPTAGVRA